MVGCCFLLVGLSLSFSPPSDCISLPSMMTWAPCPHGVRTRGKKAEDGGQCEVTEMVQKRWQGRGGSHSSPRGGRSIRACQASQAIGSTRMDRPDPLLNSKACRPPNGTGRSSTVLRWALGEDADFWPPLRGKLSQQPCSWCRNDTRCFFLEALYTVVGDQPCLRSTCRP